MIALDFPPTNLRLKRLENGMQVFDPLRKKFVALTEEDWVRQHLISYMAIQKQVPLHMMASERGLTVNKLPKRFDLVIFSQSGKPALIAECKAPQVKLDNDVFYQAAGYNMQLQVNYLLITNGLEHHCLHVDYITGKTVFMDGIPDYGMISK
jgi:hypothetical protein